MNVSCLVIKTLLETWWPFAASVSQPLLDFGFFGGCGAVGSGIGSEG